MRRFRLRLEGAKSVTLEWTEDEPEEDESGGGTDANVQLSADDVPLFGFTKWGATNPDWTDEEAP